MEVIDSTLPSFEIEIMIDKTTDLIFAIDREKFNIIYNLTVCYTAVQPYLLTLFFTIVVSFCI